MVPLHAAVAQRAQERRREAEAATKKRHAEEALARQKPEADLETFGG